MRPLTSPSAAPNSGKVWITTRTCRPTMPVVLYLVSFGNESSMVVAKGSTKTNRTVSKSTLCFRQFSSSLSGSQNQTTYSFTMYLQNYNHNSVVTQAGDTSYSAAKRHVPMPTQSLLGQLSLFRCPTQPSMSPPRPQCQYAPAPMLRGRALWGMHPLAGRA